ncbi:hypothetical protein [Actinomadura gamaensis]|uniref:Cell division protein FtsK n=1 Tax=Actinomadura gamaensis TaxID=1763541 RepID=A0ABV9U6E9_9ACTN
MNTPNTPPRDAAPQDTTRALDGQPGTPPPGRRFPDPVDGQGQGDAEVIPLRPDDAPDTEGQDEARQAPHTETPVPTDGDGPERRPIIPTAWNRDNWRATVAFHAGLWSYKARYHALRCPLYVLATAWYALAGARSSAARLWAWWQWTDGWVLESLAVADGRPGHHDAMNVHREGKKTRAARTQILAASAVGALVLLLVLALFLPWWGWLALAGVAVWLLAREGVPEGQPIVRAAVVAPAYQAPTPELITRALGALNIGAITAVIKDGTGLAFISDVHRDGDGWGVELDLPHGVTATDIIKRREALASGLRRPHSATWPEAVPHEHAGRLYLWIGRRDISKAKPAAYPLLRGGTTDVFAGVPFAVTPRGQRVNAPMFEMNWVIGAAPGQGKTTAVRALACGAALDVVCDLWIHELAGKGDLEPLAQVCHRYTSGMDDEAVAYTAESARLLRAELERRQKLFKKIPRDDKPDGKLTRELATRFAKLRPIAAFFDEVQNVILHPTYGAKFVDDLAYVERLGRAYGIMIFLATQRPDGECLPPKIRDLCIAKFCLKVPDQVTNDMILGTGAYKAGYRASEFRPKTDAGLGWLKGENETQAVRTHYLTLPDTARVAARARAMRQAAGVLSGYALGDDDDAADPKRSFAADALSVFGDDQKLWSETIAARLREALPGVYADITQPVVSSQLRALGVEVKDVRETGKANRKGCTRDDLQAVLDDARPTTDDHAEPAPASRDIP